MLGCWRIRGLLAASLYEPLEPGDKARLDRHMAACPACRARAQQLRRVTTRIAREDIPFTGDLLPVLRQRLAEESAQQRGVRWALPLAACALVLLTAGSITLWPQAAPSVQERVLASAVDPLLAEAQTLTASHDFTGALRVLQDAVSAHPEDPHAGQAQLMLAEVQFAQLQRYPEAYDAYQTLRARYPETWKASPGVVKDRFDLLSEARVKQFEPLYAFDAARNTAGDAVHELEKVVARYPGSMVATLALLAMRDNNAAPVETENAPMKAAALENLRDCLTDPIALAQLNVTLGDMYWREIHDRSRAREVYSKAAESEHAGLASLARLALAELGQE